MKKLSVAVAAALLVLAPATAASAVGDRAQAPIQRIDTRPDRGHVGVHVLILDIDAGALILDID